MTSRRRVPLVEFSLAEAPARTVSLCSGCAHLEGTNEDGTARCAAFSVIPVQVWSGRIDHRRPLQGDSGTRFSPLGEYGLTIERAFDAQRHALAAAGTETEDPVEAETEVIETAPQNRPDTPMKDAEVLDGSPPEEVHALLVREGVPTGDRRFIEEGALTWRDLPLPINWQTEQPETGGHAHSVHVVQITRMERDGSDIHAWGYLLDAEEGSDGAQFRSHLQQAGRLGISVDMDDADVEIDWPEEDEDDEGAMLFAEPELVRFTRARLMGATVVPFPAFSEAYIEFVGTDADEGEDDEADALLASAIPVAPPADWFANPRLSHPTPFTVTDDGRVFGHLAAWGTCHTSFQGTCVTPPFEEEMGYFTTGSVRTAEGAEVPVGQITLGTGHADTSLPHAAAAAHYDHTGSAIADVASGADEHGIWLAGALRPGTTPAQVRALRAAALSGDWRRIGGNLRLVAALAVNVPGFPIPRTAARVASGAQRTLVASGVVSRHRAAAPRLDAVAEEMARRIGRDRQTLVASLAERVHVTQFGCNCGKPRPKAGVVSTPQTRTASGTAASYEVIAPDGSREGVGTLIEAMRLSRQRRGTYKVVYR